MRPQFVEETQTLPPLKGAVNAGVVSKFGRELVPLTPCSQVENDPVQSAAGINAGSPHFFRWVLRLNEVGIQTP